MNSNFLQLAKEMPNTIFHLSAKDLLDFANEILAGAKMIAQLELEKSQYCDELLTIEEVCELLKVSKMTKKPYETLYQSIARLYNFIQI